MNPQKNTARTAVKAAALSDASKTIADRACAERPDDVFDCIAAGIPREQWAEAMGQVPQKLAAVDCSSVFGVKYPEDVIAPTRVAADALAWLEEVLKTIATEAPEHSRIHRLARMGACLAGDAADLADCCHKDMRAAIQKGGAA